MEKETNKLNKKESINVVNPQSEYNGKGKEYYENGDIKFEGDYINGKGTGTVPNIIQRKMITIILVLI